MLSTRDRKFLEQKARSVRRGVLEMSVAAGGGHIAPAYSCIELLATLYYSVLRVDPMSPCWEDRDRFILSKGHAVAALYVILADLGFFSRSELMTFCQAGSRLNGHAGAEVPGVEISTGSLGHGLSVGAGMAFEAKHQAKSYRTFVLLGDGECQEGQVWEAAMFSSHHQLDNLIAIIDFNQLQAIDFVENVVSLEPFVEKWRAFGWSVEVVDGHSFEEIVPAFSQGQGQSTAPRVVIAKTIKGKGISFMENIPLWHYRIPQGRELELAFAELS